MGSKLRQDEKYPSLFGEIVELMVGTRKSIGEAVKSTGPFYGGGSLTNDIVESYEFVKKENIQLFPEAKKSQLAPDTDKETFEDLMRGKGYLVNERWTNSYTFDSKIINITKESVECDCYIDKENKLFQVRSFPRVLFDDIRGLTEGKFVWIKTSYKPGSSRIDIIDAKNRIDPRPFDINQRLEALKDRGFDNLINVNEINL